MPVVAQSVGKAFRAHSEILKIDSRPFQADHSINFANLPETHSAAWRKLLTGLLPPLGEPEKNQAVSPVWQH
jgi:hypothetical protein